MVASGRSPRSAFSAVDGSAPIDLARNGEVRNRSPRLADPKRDGLATATAARGAAPASRWRCECRQLPPHEPAGAAGGHRVRCAVRSLQCCGTAGRDRIGNSRARSCRRCSRCARGRGWRVEHRRRERLNRMQFVVNAGERHWLRRGRRRRLLRIRQLPRPDRCRPNRHQRGCSSRRPRESGIPARRSAPAPRLRRDADRASRRPGSPDPSSLCRSRSQRSARPRRPSRQAV